MLSKLVSEIKAEDYLSQIYPYFLWIVAILTPGVLLHKFFPKYFLRLRLTIFISIQILTFVCFWCIYRLIDISFSLSSRILRSFFEFSLSFTKYVAESDFLDQFLTEEEHKNRIGQIKAKLRHKKREKKKFNSNQTQRRKEKTHSRKPRHFDELPNGAFTRCDVFKRNNFKSEALFNYNMDFCEDTVISNLHNDDELSWRYAFDNYSFSDFRFQCHRLIRYSCSILMHSIFCFRLEARRLYTHYVVDSRPYHQNIIDTFNAEVERFTLWNRFLRFGIQFNEFCTWFISGALSAHMGWLTFMTIRTELTLLVPEFRGSSFDKFLMFFEHALKIYDPFRSESASDWSHFDHDRRFEDLRNQFFGHLDDVSNVIKTNISPDSCERLFSLIYLTFHPRVVRYHKGILLVQHVASLMGFDNSSWFDKWLLGFAISIVGIILPLNSEELQRKLNYKSESEVTIESVLEKATDFGTTDFVRHLGVLGKFLSSMTGESSFLRQILSGEVGTTAKGVAVSSLSLLLIFHSVIYDDARSWSDLFIGEPEKKRLLNESKNLINEEFYLGKPVQGLRSIRAVVADMEKVVKQIEGELLTSKKSSSIHQKLKESLTALRKDYHLKLSQLASSRRSVPFSVILHGLPGQGKSFVRNHIFATWAMCHGLTYTELMTYTANYGDSYWEGIQPASQIFLSCPEIGDQATHILKQSGDDRMNEILPLIDGNPKPLPMAFELKGKIFALFKGIIIDTNNPTLGVEHYKQYFGAYQRRFLRVEVRIKEKFRLPNSILLDKHKLKVDEIDMRPYEFKVTKFNLSAKTACEFDKGETNYWSMLPPTKMGQATDHGLTKDGWIHDHRVFTSCIAHLYSQHHLHENKIVSQFPNYYDSFLDRYESISRRYNIERISTEDDYKSESLITDNWMLCVGSFSIGCLFVWLFNFTSAIFRDTRRCVFSFMFWLLRVPPENQRFIQQFLDVDILRYIQFYRRLCEIRDSVLTNRNRYSILLCCFLIFLIYKRPSYFSEGSMQDINTSYDCGNSYKRIPIKNHNYWNVVKNGYSPVHKNGIDSLSHVVSKNLISVKVTDENGTEGNVCALGVKQDFCILNKHAFSGASEKYRVKVVHPTGVISQTVPVDMDDIVSIGSDLCVVRLRSMQFRNITNHFPSDDFVPYSTVGIIDGETVSITPSTGITYNSPNGVISPKIVLEYKWKNHKNGACGTPLLASIGNGSSIIGIHSMGKSFSPQSGALIAYRSLINKAINELSEDYVLAPTLSREEFVSESGTVLSPDLNHKSLFRYEFTPHLEVEGRLPGPILVKNKSKLLRNFDTKFLDEFFLKHFNHVRSEKFSKPVMQPVTINGSYVSPYNIAVNKLNRPLSFFR
jgi:hypothetical protein